MSKKKFLVRFGVTGTIIAAIGCFTPALVLLFGALGLSALTGYLDTFLLPALGIFIGITIYAVYRAKRSGGRACATRPNIGDANE